MTMTAKITTTFSGMARQWRLLTLLGLCLLLPTWAFAQDDAEGAESETASGQVPESDSEAATEPSEGGDTAGDQAGEKGTAPAAGSASASAEMDGATYRVRLRDLEQKVDGLKEQIRRSHTRLSLLSDTILSGAAGGARAEIEFVNELSGAWRIIEAIVVLDGAVQYKKTDDSGALSEQKLIPIFSGSIPTGDHTVQVLLKLRGHGYGVFSYLRGMEATVRNDYSFTVSDGKVIELTATAWEQGGPTTPVEEQPSIRFSETLRSMSDSPAAPASDPAASPAAAKVDAKATTGSAGGTVTTEAAASGGK